MKENSKDIKKLKRKKKPGILISSLPVVFLIFLLGYSNLILKLDFESGGAHIPMILSTGVAALAASYLGFSWKEIQTGIVKGIHLALAALLILMIIGCLIGVWILSGIVPGMIFYGLKMISPQVFLVTTCVICAVVSISTGSSWSTAGTVGIALVGVGTAMGIPVKIVAGAIISGAYFGDKMSPLSDTTNLAPATAGTDVFTHVRHMVYVGLPSLFLTLIIFTIIGFKYSGSYVDSTQVSQILNTIDTNFELSPWILFPPVLVILMVIFKIPALPALLGGTILGGLIAIFFQDAAVADVIKTAYSGYASSSGSPQVDSLLSRGGLNSMMGAVAVTLCALSFGGVMELCGMLETLADTILKLARSTGSLVTATIGTCIGMNIVTSDQYLSIVIPGRMYKNAYEKRNLHPKNLSRALEGSATVSSPLIPWNACGAFMGGVLGVSAAEYFIFSFFNLIVPVVCILFAFTGFSMTKLRPEKQ